MAIKETLVLRARQKIDRGDSVFLIATSFVLVSALPFLSQCGVLTTKKTLGCSACKKTNACETVLWISTLAISESVKVFDNRKTLRFRLAKKKGAGEAAS